MFLKNYTSEIPVHQTIYRIEQVLIRCGVSGITKEYAPTPGKVSALIFSIKFDGTTEVSVRLPADEEKALQALWLNYVGSDKLSADGKTIVWNRSKKKQRSDFLQQAERTAWKIIQDWVEVQMSMIQMKQAEFQQVFLPYVWDAAKKQTLFDKVKAAGYAGLLPEKTNTHV